MGAQVEPKIFEIFEIEIDPCVSSGVFVFI